ncbi:hypothetical protein POSPLADRAFT_1149567 [Postia placenta MAD-698-R-SB12]|uniref:Anaphase-promoting complex subunit 2 n=1 Tax=Postia placenta MAD-698-R-SB12 TaxID=670580 RepID=A0A1X6MU21_9APHY|nr:hypothetical protein POSPLADRAFT_1149567 [Postia placenta MAD-698-R-SB12]OSX59891.1 hypothetical protein POSPLADRAFT_1149567 [Postia placenta MAD-698-R-SB12]
MASEAIQRQIATKWQGSFTRLNRDQPGILGLLSFSEAWKVASDFLQPRDLTDPSSKKEYNVQQIKVAIDILSKSKMLPMLLENFLGIQYPCRGYASWQHTKCIPLSADLDSSSPVCLRRQKTPNILLGLVTNTRFPYDDNLTLSRKARAHHSLRIYPCLPDTRFLGPAPIILERIQRASTSPPPWAPPSLNPTQPMRYDLPLWTAFEHLGLLDRYESLISSVCYEHIETHILETCAEKWGTPMLNQLREWMTNKIVPWMVMPYARGARSAEEARSMLQGVGSRFDFHVCKTLADLRTKEIFDIIVDYPDSSGALQDLKECLARVDQRAPLVQTLRKANKKRLLHPGADTKDIITQYVSIIRCLRIVDPPGVLLFKVADPIRKYLRERPDTIRCIVASLVGDDESGDSLVDENEPIQPLQQLQVEDFTDPNWEPEPIDAGPDFRTNKPSDVISTLYCSRNAIPGSKHDSQDPLWGGRFTNMTDSKRTDQHVQSQKRVSLHPTIISKHFWPPLQSSKFHMPGQFKQIQDDYAKEFMAFKPDKRLRWLPHLGTIHLEIELQDRTVPADVPPLEAAFIELFSERDLWTVDELIARVGSVDRTSALRALMTWAEMGVLKEDGDNRYRLLEVAEDGSSSGSRPAPPKPAQIIEDVPAVLTVQHQQAEQMKIFWKFIEGMLTNLGTLSLDRIQTMLKFAPGYDRTIEQLGAFMEAARREGLVNVKDGMWKLNRQ